MSVGINKDASQASRRYVAVTIIALAKTTGANNFTFSPIVLWISSLEQDAFDTAVVGLADVVDHPVVAQQVFGHLNHNVIGRRVGVIIVAGQALKAGGAGCQYLDVA